jgi:hypothetical protein
VILFDIIWADSAKETFNYLKSNPSEKKHYKSVKNAINKLAQNPKYPGLQSHPFESLKGVGAEKVYESYAENNTPGAYRLFWYYGATKNTINLFLITHHP